MGRRKDRTAFDATGLDELGKAMLVVLGLEALGLGRDERIDLVAAGLLDLPPFLDVVAVGPLAGAARGLVDGDLEARVEDDLARAPPVPGEHLGGDVAPPDDGHRGHVCVRLPT